MKHTDSFDRIALHTCDPEELDRLELLQKDPSQYASKYLDVSSLRAEGIRAIYKPSLFDRILNIICEPLELLADFLCKPRRIE